MELAVPDYLLDAAIETGRQTLRLCGAFGEHLGDSTGLGLAGYLEGKDHGLVVFEAKFLCDDRPDFGNVAAGLRGDLPAHGCGVELLADFDATSNAPLPPPRGAYAREAVVHERRRAVGKELIEILGHRVFIPAVGLPVAVRYYTMRRGKESLNASRKGLDEP